MVMLQLFCYCVANAPKLFYKELCYAITLLMCHIPTGVNRSTSFMHFVHIESFSHRNTEKSQYAMCV